MKKNRQLDNYLLCLNVRHDVYLSISLINKGSLKMIRKNTDKLINFKFFSLADFYNTVSEKIGDTYDSRNYESQCKHGNRDVFNGASRSEIIERKHSWPEGVSMLKNLSDMEKVITKQWSKIWNNDDGDDMCLERFYNDMPFLQKRIKVLGVKSRNNIIQKILVNPCESAGVRAKEMLWKTYTAVKIADHLESQGVRCEITIKYLSRNIDNKNRDVTLEIPIKEANEPINTSLLCAVFSPWFFRYWIIHLLKSSIENVSVGLGQPKKISKEENENCIIIDSGTALSKTAANNFLKGIEL